MFDFNCETELMNSIIGPYLLTEQIGEGGTANVFHAIDNEDPNRHAVIKIHKDKEQYMSQETIRTILMQDVVDRSKLAHNLGMSIEQLETEMAGANFIKNNIHEIELISLLQESIGKDPLGTIKSLVNPKMDGVSRPIYTRSYLEGLIQRIVGVTISNVSQEDSGFWPVEEIRFMEIDNGLIYPVTVYNHYGDGYQNLKEYTNNLDRDLTTDPDKKFQLISHVLKQFELIAKNLHLAYDKSKVVHRDIKLENLIILRNGKVVLTDFGLAMISNHTSREAISGTFSIMPPEQLEHRKSSSLNYKSDAFSFAATIADIVRKFSPLTDIDNSPILKREYSSKPNSKVSIGEMLHTAKTESKSELVETFPLILQKNLQIDQVTSQLIDTVLRRNLAAENTDRPNNFDFEIGVIRTIFESLTFDRQNQTSYFDIFGQIIKRNLGEKELDAFETEIIEIYDEIVKNNRRARIIKSVRGHGTAKIIQLTEHPTTYDRNPTVKHVDMDDKETQKLRIEA